MVTIRNCKLIVVSIALTCVCGEVVANAPKATCPKECERRAKAALAVAATKPPARAVCPCGDSCKCEAGACPTRCPATAYREVWYRDESGRVWRQLEPSAANNACPQGRCPAPR